MRIQNYLFLKETMKSKLFMLERLVQIIKRENI